MNALCTVSSALSSVAGKGCAAHYVHNDKPSEETPVTSHLSIILQTLTCIFRLPFQSQNIRLRVPTFRAVFHKLQRCRIPCRQRLVSLLVLVLVLRLHLAFDTCKFFVAEKIDNGSLLASGVGSAIQHDPETLAALVGWGSGGLQTREGGLEGGAGGTLQVAGDGDDAGDGVGLFDGVNETLNCAD